jgi:hypothetical protein
VPVNGASIPFMSSFLRGRQIRKEATIATVGGSPLRAMATSGPQALSRQSVSPTEQSQLQYRGLALALSDFPRGGGTR